MVFRKHLEQAVSTAHFDNISRLYVGWPTRANTAKVALLPVALLPLSYAPSLLTQRAHK